MKFGYLLTLVAVAFLSITTFAGCEYDSESTSAKTEDHDHGDHDHDHDHDHDDSNALPVHGPNGGHLFAIDGSEKVGEWMHYNDNDIIRVVLLDKDLKNAVPVDAITITPTAGDDKTAFELELDGTQNKGDQKLVYMIDDKQLQVAMSLGVKVEFTIGDEKISGTIAPHTPHDH